MQPTPIQSSGPSSSNSASPATPAQATATRNPKVVLVAGLGILGLIMVAVFGILAGINKPSAPTQEIAAEASGGEVASITRNLPGAGLTGEFPHPLGASASPPAPPALPASPASSIFAPDAPPASAALSQPPNSSIMLLDPAPIPPRSAPSATGPDKVQTSAGPSAARPAPATTASRRYTVKESDTLWKIAQTHLGNGTQWHRIVAANPGLTPEKLRAGMKINLPDGAADNAAPGARSAGRASNALASSSTQSTVTVRPGDTLYAIARREYGNGELWDVIYRANQSRLPNPHNLPTGMTLALPARPNR